jgi:hypothetical protein
MLIYGLLLILLMPFVILSLTIENLFSPDELIEMGIHIGNSPAEEP